MIVLIDNGHGIETKGKRSVDSRLLEWSYTRMIAKRISERLSQAGVKSVLLTPEDEDVSLQERVKRANDIAAKGEACILVSVHCDAANNGEEWHSAHGWSVRVSENASVSSKSLAGIIARKASANGLRVRRPKPTQDYWVQSLYICKKTTCPAILTENLFMTNEADVDFLLSEQGKQIITKVHVDGIVEYIKEHEK